MTAQSSVTKKCYPILDDLTVNVEVLHNDYQFELEELFQMATRINKKRSFLFVSKVLGKHLAVNPHIPLLTGNLLAMRYMEVVHGNKDPRIAKLVDAIRTGANLEEIAKDIQNAPLVLPQETTFIGFAETATALGHAVFSSFGQNAQYIHTTREQLIDRTSVINFEEEHSHATSHRVYALNEQFFEGDSEVVLVDDEMTTGKTAINIIQTIKQAYPKKKVFTVVAILDWRTAEQRAAYRKLAEELAIDIHVVALIEGMISTEGQPELAPEEVEVKPVIKQEVSQVCVHSFFDREMFEVVRSIEANGKVNHSAYVKGTGRFGLSSEENHSFVEPFQQIGSELKGLRKGEKTLVIGTGEFMYVPMKIATFMGPHVYFQATTRSPIYQTKREGYMIHNKFTFNSPENAGLINHLYNIGDHQYDEIMIFVERMSAAKEIDSLVEALRTTKIPFITVVVMAEIVE